jgi:dihydroorotate dehydrogenase (fumarate)
VIDLRTRYLGLDLRNPLVCSSSPLCQDVANLRRMEAAGAGAVVLHSLFEEQIERESLDLDHFLHHGGEGYAESLSYFPDLTGYNLGPEGYLEHVRQAKAALTIPVIASLNGRTRGGWVDYAKQIEDAGADALELNVGEVPTDPEVSAADVEGEVVSLVGLLCRTVRLPVAVKLGPFYTAPVHLARRIVDAGAKGLVLFNRFYQPDFDVDRLEVTPHLTLSTPDELRLRLHWVALLHGRIQADLAVTGGVHAYTDVIKSLLAGASVAMMTSALLRYGIDHLADVLEGVTAWLVEREYHSLRTLRGCMSFLSTADPAAYVRANYVKVLRSHAVFPAGV